MKNPLSKVECLKRKARKALAVYELCANQYNCGSRLAEEINPRMSMAKQNFNAAMDELKALGEPVPESRLW